MLIHFCCVQLSATPWSIPCQAPLPMGFSRQEYWSGLPCPPPGNLPIPGIEPTSLIFPELAGRYFTTSVTWQIPNYSELTKPRLKSESVSHSVVSNSLQPHGVGPARLLCPWDFPSKNTGVGCHFLLQGIFPTQQSYPGLLHCRHILYQLSYKGSWEDELIQSAGFSFLRQCQR